VALEQGPAAFSRRPVAEVVPHDRGEHANGDDPSDRQRSLRREDGAGDQNRFTRDRQAERLECQQHEQEHERPLAVGLDEALDRRDEHGYPAHHR
jgi:hypothetical protein